MKALEQRTFWKQAGYFISSGSGSHLCSFPDKFILNSFCVFIQQSWFLQAFRGGRLLMTSVCALKSLLPLLWGAADLGSIF